LREKWRGDGDSEQNNGVMVKLQSKKWHVAGDPEQKMTCCWRSRAKNGILLELQSKYNGKMLKRQSKRNCMMSLSFQTPLKWFIFQTSEPTFS
jgi:hypothetical protein